MTSRDRPSVLPWPKDCRTLLGALLVLISANGMHAGPPFLTDDPEPVDLNNWEFYVFGQGDRSDLGNAVSGPAIEINYGIAPYTQIHLVAPVANESAPGQGWTSGYGDTEVGIKYRFVDETDSSPQIGIFPMAEFATASRGLGNGRTWYRLPLWIQKSWGPWTSYGGGGEALNSAPGQRNYPFGGCVLQRTLGKSLALGGELFSQGAISVGARGTTRWRIFRRHAQFHGEVCASLFRRTLGRGRAEHVVVPWPLLDRRSADGR